MKVLIIKHKVRLFFKNAYEDISLSYTEEHPGNEVPIYSLEAERESLRDNIDDLLGFSGYKLKDKYIKIKVLKTSVRNEEKLLSVKEW